MGANSQQGWALLLFVLGFTFVPAGLLALGPIFLIAGLVLLVVSIIWFIRIKPLEESKSGSAPHAVNMPASKKAS